MAARDVGQGKGRLDRDLSVGAGPDPLLGIRSLVGAHARLSAFFLRQTRDGPLAQQSVSRPLACEGGGCGREAKTTMRRSGRELRRSVSRSSGGVIPRVVSRGVEDKTAAAGNEDAITTHPGLVVLVLVM